MENVDTTHLGALLLKLSHERERLNRAKSEKERELRSVWVQQAEKEIAGELKLLGLPPDYCEPKELSLDEIFAELTTQ